MTDSKIVWHICIYKILCVFPIHIYNNNNRLLYNTIILIPTLQRGSE